MPRVYSVYPTLLKSCLKISTSITVFFVVSFTSQLISLARYWYVFTFDDLLEKPWSQVSPPSPAPNEYTPPPVCAERRKRHISSREEEKVDAQMCPCGKAIETKTHIVGECEMYKEERDVLEA